MPISPNSPIRHLQFCGIDFESAGASKGSTDVPVQIAIAHWSVEDGHSEHFDSYLRSDTPITWSARKVHGIRDEDLVGAPSLLELWPPVKRLLGDGVVVAHGKGTEKRFLRAFPGHGFGPWIDTLLLARATWPTLPDHSLSSICEVRHLTDRVRQLAPERKWHDALFDTVASLVVLESIVTELSLEDHPLEILTHPDTTHWRRDRQG